MCDILSIYIYVKKKYNFFYVINITQKIKNIFYIYIICKIFRRVGTIMAYAILTMDKYHTFHQLSGLQRHNDREIPLPHVDGSKSIFNQNLIHPGGTYTEAFKNRLLEAEVQYGHKVRSRRNSVLLFEFMLTYSKDADVPIKEWAQANVDWLKRKFGEENIISCVLHMDETTPHIHADIIPIDKNGNLAAKNVIDGPFALKKLQTEYAKEMEQFGLTRGEKNTKAKKRTLKEFYGAVNEIDKNPAPEKFPDESEEEYIKRLKEYIRMQKLAIYKLTLDADRNADVIDTRVDNALYEYSNAINLYNQIADNYDSDLDIINRRLFNYIQLERAVPRAELDKVIKFLKEKYPPEESVLSYAPLPPRLRNNDDEEKKEDKKKIKVQLLE